MKCTIGNDIIEINQAMLSHLQLEKRQFTIFIRGGDEIFLQIKEMFSDITPETKIVITNFDEDFVYTGFKLARISYEAPGANLNEDITGHPDDAEYTINLFGV